MSDDKVTKIESKNPVDGAVNKIKEVAAKELQSKFDAQVKKTLDAAKIFAAEKDALKKLKADSEDEKTTLAILLRSINE